MKPRFPLYAKVLLWFFLNLVLLAAVGGIILRVQIRAGLDSFLGGYTGQRLEPVARALLAEIESAPAESWDAVFARHSAQHGVEFLLFGLHQEQLAGPPRELPPDLVRRLPKGPPRPPGRGDGREPFRRPPRPLDGGTEGFIGAETPPERNGPSAGGGPPAAGARVPPDGLLPIHQRFMHRTESPPAYWVGLLLALRTPAGGAGRPAVFLARAETFTGNGLFFDYRPWLAALAGIIGLSVLFWLPLVRHITRAIGQLNTATAEIADGRFGVTVDLRRRDELGQLGGSINRLAARLHGFVKGQKRFLGDVAHELCSPIARIQMSLGILERQADPRQQRCLEDLREEVQHMSNLVNELLSFSKASLRPEDVKLQRVDLGGVADKAVRQEAADRDVRVDIPAGLAAQANPELLQRALANLIRNALRYAGDAGPITVRAQTQGHQVELIVADQGPGIPAEHLDHVFESFYRIDASRQRETGGVGLGLAIVRTCIEACRGSVQARNRQPHGLEVVIRLDPG